MLDVEWTFRMINVLQQRRPGEKGFTAPERALPLLQKGYPWARGMGGQSRLSQVKRGQNTKHAKIAKMRFRSLCLKFPVKNSSKRALGVPLCACERGFFSPGKRMSLLKGPSTHLGYAGMSTQRVWGFHPRSCFNGNDEIRTRDLCLDRATF